MDCPRLHGRMTQIELTSDSNETRLACFCETCHAVFLSEADSCDFVGIDVSRIHKTQFQVPAIDLKCPACKQNLKMLELYGWRVYACTDCLAVFLDSNIMAYLMNLVIEKEREAGAVVEHAPVEHMSFKCSDCGATIENCSDVTPSPIGCSCKKCASNPPVLSESKQQEVQIVTFHGMEVKIDRPKSSKTSRISVTPAEPGKLNVDIHSLNFVERSLRFGWRKLALHGQLRRNLDASEGINQLTPWHAFLKQRGVIECFEIIQEMGNIHVTFKPHNLIFELEGEHIGAETRLRFEATIRRLVIAYERFVAMTHEVYENSTCDAASDELSE